MQTVRITFDLMRAVPLTPLTSTTNVIRAGRRVHLTTASLWSGDVEVARATALRIRIGEVELPDSPLEPWVPHPAPQRTPLATWASWERGGELTRFHRDAVEVRSVDNSFWTPERGLSWIRLLFPVVAGAPVTPLVRTAALADVANGNAMALDPSTYLFVNPDATLYLHRQLKGEWLGMDSVAQQHRTGIGLTDTTLFDEEGPIGRVNQAQLLERRDD